MKRTFAHRIAEDTKASPAPCYSCNGSGVFYCAGRVENGKFIGFSGVCFRCGGKGTQTAKDENRNAYYDNHVRRGL